VQTNGQKIEDAVIILSPQGICFSIQELPEVCKFQNSNDK
jgi:hypothetical protein